MKTNYNKDWLQGIKYENLTYLIQSDKLYGYREFCRILNIPICPSGSNSQIRQLNELSMICEYEKINHKYNFISLSTEDEIKLYNHRSVYITLIELCLLEKFLEFQEKETDNNFQHGILFFSLSTLMQWCGIVHDNFTIAKHSNIYSKRIICLKHEYNLDEFNHFLTISYNKLLKPLLRSALKTLDNRGSIVIHKGFKLFSVGSNGYITYRNILSSGSIGQQLEQIIAQVYTEFHIGKVQELFFMEQQVKNRFYHRCNEICQQTLGYSGFYDCYAISMNWNRMRHNIQVLQQELNKRIQTKFQTSTLLQDLNPQAKQQFILSMIDLDSLDDYKEDLLEYSQFKTVEGEQ